ncbi:THUMP-like domain-containing protein [Actinomycetospora callitridis]|uniref:THUMP-like domain-containing protein n=1 Tax=Actinomycetospora callitridis TaxID=913944 RepID=UPI0023653DCF|nr:class I SAM-dependent methyltransferase [Actinomycetospora callitridis]MDD7916771.1 class I SAM-dependent methyltransferase [Actinomycetospora callitridis]
MTYSFTLDDVAYLASSAGREAVLRASELVGDDRLRAVTVLRERLGDRAAPVLETALLQARVRGRVPDGWLLTADAAEQATAAPVAAHRASRLAGRDVHDVTCSVGAELDALRHTASRLVGSDLDPVRLAMARVNVPSVPLVRADALAPVTRDTVLVADPARRTASGRRTWRPADFVPPLDELVEAAGTCPRRGAADVERPYRHAHDVVVSTAPGLDPALVPWAAEVELVSLDGRVREAALWSAGLATTRRRATVLSSRGPGWEVTDAEDDDCPVGPAGEWIVDPDGAVVRAGLVRQYGARHGLWRVDEHLAYLTGDAPPPGIRAFRVLEHGRYSEKTLRTTLRRRGVGRVEILVRGLDVDPNALRPRLKLAGSQEATVVLARLETGPEAYVCEAVSDRVSAISDPR